MPRVPPGGPPIPPKTGASAEPQATKTDFGAKVAAAQAHGTDEARFQQAKKTSANAALTENARQIAKRLSKGELSQREATREFVSLVIEERFPQFKKKNKKGGRGGGDQSNDDMEEAVVDLIDEDALLAKRLRKQFEKLATAKD